MECLFYKKISINAEVAKKMTFSQLKKNYSKYGYDMEEMADAFGIKVPKKKAAEQD